ncbi:beta-2-glycoprotein 1-like [Rhinophrynus dorsalis]
MDCSGNVLGVVAICAVRSNCPWPVNIDNANTTLVKGTRNFGDQMLVLCHQGFKMATGQEKVLSRCQGDRKWSATAPCNDVQKPMVSCSAPPNIENGYVMEKATSFWVGESVQYKCNLGYQLEGHDVSACMENRSWSHPAPTCRQLFCPPPPEINDGYLIAVKKSEYEVSEEIYYLCKKNFYLDGSNSVTCEADGKWSESPACRARCKIPAQRSRVLYNGKKLWITEIPEALVHHSETVTFFCQHKDESCSYPASSQCFDGVLSLPECYEEPTWVQYNLFPKKVVSEIASCQEH